jgi:hypothetical protein
LTVREEAGEMSHRVALICVFVLVMAACGGDDGADESVTTTAAAGSGSTTTMADAGGGGGGGEVVNQQAPGAAVVSIDGQDFAFDTVGPVGCSVSGDEITVGFVLPDNEASFIAGANASGSEWRGRIDVNVQSADGITNYFADFSQGDGGAIAVDGSSFSYSGDWEVFRPGGSEAEPAGQGTISATC